MSVFRVFLFLWREILDSLWTINRPHLQFSGLQVFFKDELVILILDQRGNGWQASHSEPLIRFQGEIVRQFDEEPDGSRRGSPGE